MTRVTIDTCTYDPSNEEFVLYLVEDEPWPDDDPGWRSRLTSIQDRILSAVDVAVDGHLSAQYPESRGHKVRIQIDSPSGCPDHLEGLVAEVGRFLREDRSYADAIAGSPQVLGLRVVTGKQMGRFRSSPSS
jgi:hypothetical protein